MAEIEIREGKLYVNGLQLDTTGTPSSTGKSILLAAQTVKIGDIKVQITAYKKA